MVLIDVVLKEETVISMFSAFCPSIPCIYMVLKSPVEYERFHIQTIKCGYRL